MMILQLIVTIIISYAKAVFSFFAAMSADDLQYLIENSILASPPTHPGMFTSPI